MSVRCSASNISGKTAQQKATNAILKFFYLHSNKKRGLFDSENCGNRETVIYKHIHKYIYICIYQQEGKLVKVLPLQYNSAFGNHSGITNNHYYS